MHDSLDHPDLVEVGRRMQDRLDRVLDAERAAAVVVARRTATLRDRLLEAEDADAKVTVTLVGGSVVSGRPAAVTADHLELWSASGTTLIPLDAVVAVAL